jgi:hypothetical protein
MNTQTVYDYILINLLDSVEVDESEDEAFVTATAILPNTLQVAIHCDCGLLGGVEESLIWRLKHIGLG